MKKTDSLCAPSVVQELNRLVRSMILFVGIMVLSVSNLAAQENLFIGRFSSDKASSILPSGWEPLLFKSIKKHTAYILVSESGQTVVKAVSKGSSSGLIRHVKIDPKKFPIIEWRWKISDILEKGDVTKKAGDDYPARLYIAFEFEPEKADTLERTKYKALGLFFGKTPPAGAINYIWASKAADGTVVPSLYTSRSIMVVVQSGEKEVNRWVTERRNIRADYVAAFGKEPPMISAVAIMTDGNDTGESATAFYGDIVMHAGE